MPGGGDETYSQTDQLEALLAANSHRRKVDRLLLSVGGNDIGFVPVIEYAVAPPTFGLGPIFDAIPATFVGRFWERHKGPVRRYRSDTLTHGRMEGVHPWTGTIRSQALALSAVRV